MSLCIGNKSIGFRNLSLVLDDPCPFILTRMPVSGRLMKAPWSAETVLAHISIDHDFFFPEVSSHIKFLSMFSELSLDMTVDSCMSIEAL